MAHSRRCADSMSDAKRCRCSCNGGQHGGTYYSLSIGGGRSDAQNGRDADRPTAVQRAVAEIIDWLTENPTVEEQVTAIADLVAEQAVAALEKYGRVTSRKELTLNHFLCGLLAALAQAIDKFKHSLDRVPDLVISAITGKSDQLGLNTVAVRVAVRTSWRLIMQLPIFGQIDSLLRATRIAAVLTCPALDRHPDIIRNCLYPLAGDIISAATKRRLEEVFSPGYIS